MKSIKSKLRIWLTAILASLSVLAMSLGLTACGGGNLKIDVPERIEEDMGTGTYVVPRYDVVNDIGVIMAGYTVRLKSVTDPNGEAAEISREASTIVTLVGAGEYTFVYTADSKNVKDATVIMDFADRKAPTIKLSSSLFPSFYIKNVTYAVPEYTLAGDFVASKCYTKVFYNDGQSEAETEVTMDDGSFTVTNAAGKYTVLIHVEDAAGNFNEYRYTRSVYSPEHYDEHTVVYFNEAFGEKQVAPEGDYAGKFVSVADGGKGYDGEAGSYKIEFDGKETNNNEAYFAINVPAIANIMEYKELEMYVYIEDANCPNNKTEWVVGSKWWNDTKVKAGEWTRVTWSVANWGNGVGANSGATTANVISTDNISGTRIRLVPDAMFPDKDTGAKTPAPHGTVYFSSMRVVPHEPSVVTAGENVTLDKRDGNYHIGDTVTLTAAEIEGKTFDCFLVDGAPIGGNTFVASKATYEVTAKYVVGDLTYENMTKADFAAETVTNYEGWVNFCKTGESAENWVIEYKVKKNMAAGSSVGVYLGADHWAEIELGKDEKKLHAHVENQYYWIKAADLSADTIAKLESAGTTNVTLTWIRKGNTLLVVLDGTQLVGKFDFGNYHTGAMEFGTMYRGDATKDTIGEIWYVAGEVKTNLCLETLAVTLTKDDNVTTDKENYYLGDTVTLTAAEAPAGQAFSYFTVDDEPITGNTLVLRKFSYSVAAHYAEISELDLGEGIATADGKTTVGKGSTVTLVFHGKSPAGKYFYRFAVDGNPIPGNTFVTSKSSHKVTAEFLSRTPSGSEKLNDASKVQGTDDWVSKGNNFPTKVEYVTDFYYDGIDASVPEDGVLKVTVSRDDNGFSLKQTCNKFMSDYESLYFYAYTEASGVKVGSWWCADTTLTPGKWCKVEITRGMNLKGLYDEDVWNTQIEKFVYRFMSCKAGDVFYVTEVFGVPYDDVTVTVDNDVKDYVSVSAPVNGATYKVSETITLVCNGAPTDKKLFHFTINGDRYDGTTYQLKVTDTTVTVGAVFTDISTLSLGEGVKTSDGEREYAQGVKVRLSFDTAKLNGKVVDYYLVDKGTTSERRVYNGEFVATAATHTVEAVLALPNVMTWANGGTGYGYETVMGNDAAEWKARALDGEVYGSAEYWAVSVNVKHTNEWNSFEFIQGSKQSIRVRFHHDGFCGVVLMNDNYTEQAPKDSGFTVAYPTKNVQVVAKLLAGATVTCVRNGDTISMYIDGYKFFETNYAVDHTGNWFGVGYASSSDNGGATKPEMSNTKYITGKDKVEAYLAAYAASDKAPKSATQINGISGAKVFGEGKANLEYVNAPAGLTDANVKETGVMKVTVTGGEAAINVDFSFIPDLTAFEKVYFWIYTESENVQAGTHWCANTNAPKGQWTKITVTRNTNWAYDGGVKHDGVPTGTHGNPYDKNNSSSFVYRLMNTAEKASENNLEITVYVTSLYGVPKSAD